ncbi:ribonuclease P protein component [Lutimonas zeaxanthinifaciens]|uniref:ribonuclease P protein component n=1 Tax=Lutimonas zeaxanthinifaciens TaxID=3060215 RepID=UPI00265CB3EA|nr:ribonuclease P protein component [Lutimonas sp. YSD2104]WKK66056.1 ribonuclease P protein component [Lutimonas sp. YSD2104]
MRETFRKDERLKKKNLISELFASGRSATVFPIKMIYLEYDHLSPFKIQAGVSVSKRNFKNAVQRNRIKRLMREAYRKNKSIIYNDADTKKHIIMFIYQAKEEISFDLMDRKMNQLIRKFLTKQKPQSV